MTTPIERFSQTPHDVQTTTKSSPLIVFAVALSLVLAVAFATFVADSEATATGAGTVTVGDDLYSFEATTCAISEGDFVVAGPGQVGTTPLWVSASGREITVAVGVQSELEQPESGRPWLSSDGPIRWNFGDGGLNASTVVFDVRQPARALPATLTVSCGPESQLG